MVWSPRRLTRSGAAALLLSAVFMTMLLLTRSATAQERAVAFDKPRLAQAPEPYCFCWNDGKKIAEGSMACIRTTQGRRLATCGRVINMMSWEVTENPCPES
jgi:hypothetical protein